MQNGKCPKCSSDQVFHGLQSPLRAGEGLVHLEASPPKRSVNLLLDAYVCANCGYVEMYVAEGSKAKLSALAEDEKSWRRTG